MLNPAMGRFLTRLNHYGPPDAAEVAAISGAFGRPKSYAEREALVRQFTSPSASTLLLAGMAGRVVTLPSGSQQITALQVPGDFVDLHAFVLGQLDHSVVAMSDCTVMTAAHSTLRRLTNHYPRLTRALWHLTLVDAAIHRQWLAMLGRRDALARLAHLFCELYMRLDDVGLVAAHSFVFPLTQIEVADALSLSTVHVNRIARELRVRGLITWQRRAVTVLNWPSLCEVAQFDPSYLQLNGQVSDEPAS